MPKEPRWEKAQQERMSGPFAEPYPEENRERMELQAEAFVRARQGDPSLAIEMGLLLPEEETEE